MSADRAVRLRVDVADEGTRDGAISAPHPKRDALAAIMPLMAADAADADRARGVRKFAERWYRRIGLRRLVVVPLLVALLGGGAWVVASHLLSLRQRGNEAVSVGSTWWNGARDRVFAVASDLKLAAFPSPAPERVAGTEPAAASKKKTPPAKRRTHAVAEPAANASEGALGGAAWRNARWGMTVNEVLAAFPSEAVRSGAKGDSSRPLAERAVIKSARLGSVTGRVSFLFGRNGKLAAIVAKPVIGNDPDQIYSEVAQWLSGEMGTPTQQESRIAPSGARVEVSSWTTPDTAVHLSRAPRLAPNARILAVDLSSGEILPHGIELWYEPVSSPAASPPAG